MSAFYVGKKSVALGNCSDLRQNNVELLCQTGRYFKFKCQIASAFNEKPDYAAPFYGYLLIYLN